MKKTLLVLTLAALLGACTSMQEGKATAKTEKTAVAEKKVEVKNAAILLPINNTNDQDTAELLWANLSKNAEKKAMSREEVEKKLKTAGYSYGDQLVQLDTAEKKVELQNKLGTEELVYLTVEEISSSLSKNPFSPSTTRLVKGEAKLYVNGVEVQTYEINGSETKKISKDVLTLTLKIGTEFVSSTSDMEAALRTAIVSIQAITDEKMRSEVAEAVLAVAGPAGTKLQTLMFEKGLLDESPYQTAVNEAAKKFSKTL